MTARELYESDGGFRGFFAAWEKDKRCPLPLVDYLLDRGMDSQAEAARWAATTPDARQFKYGGMSGPVPSLDDGGGGKSYNPYWYWFVVPEKDERIYSDYVPEERLSDDAKVRRDSTMQEAMLWLLDNWIAAKETVDAQ